MGNRFGKVSQSDVSIFLFIKYDLGDLITNSDNLCYVAIAENNDRYVVVRQSIHFEHCDMPKQIW